jgi:aspartate racemase
MLMKEKREVYGVVGGMGPLASAEFLKTIYEFSLNRREQESPVVHMLSDPTFPDRTDAFLSGSYTAVLEQLVDSVERLSRQGATKIVICCMTIHYLLPTLPHELRKRIVSLLDVIFENIIASEKRHLVICTKGTRRLALFESHPRWEQARDYLVFAGESDQETIHYDIIYRIKQNPSLATLTPKLEALMAKYEVDSFIAGCSEIHLLAKHYASSVNNTNGYGCLDPLTILAKQWSAARASTGEHLELTLESAV